MELNIRNEENKEFFDEKASGYDEVHKPFMNTKKKLIEVIDNEPKNVVDLGAGTGLELTYYFDKYPNTRVKAIDLSSEMLNKLRERDFADRVDIVCGDFFTVDFGKDVDVVMSTSALHHFLYADKIKLYKKIYDSLRDGGLFINSDYTAKDEAEEKKLIDDYENRVNRHNDTPLSLEHEIEILKMVGFKEIEVQQPEKESYKLFKARK
ncbi:MAG: class I SAM-dependent methyltransferase [Bacilli bacterium]|nr:class I SAM-dependent methyltransferase [Bacilli bacterium]